MNTYIFSINRRRHSTTNHVLSTDDKSNFLSFTSKAEGKIVISIQLGMKLVMTKSLVEGHLYYILFLLFFYFSKIIVVFLFLTQS